MFFGHHHEDEEEKEICWGCKKEFVADKYKCEDCGQYTICVDYRCNYCQYCKEYKPNHGK